MGQAMGTYREIKKTRPKWHHRDPDDPDFQQQIVAASMAESPTLYTAMEKGRNKAAAGPRRCRQ